MDYGVVASCQSLNLTNWCIAAGVIRNEVWDHLHSYNDRTQPTDIDVLFYDDERIADQHEAEIEAQLAAIIPGVRWEAVNQASVHLYTKDEPYGSIEEAMSRWADQVTAVGAYLTDDGQIAIVAPSGLNDLFDMIVRPNLLPPNAEAVYRNRMTTKRWNER